jgi:hypothetical protein
MAFRMRDDFMTPSLPRSGHEGKGAGSVTRVALVLFPRLPDWRSLLTS